MRSQQQALSQLATSVEQIQSVQMKKHELSLEAGRIETRQNFSRIQNKKNEAQKKKQKKTGNSPDLCADSLQYSSLIPL